MTEFKDTTDKLDFLKKYKLAPKSATEIPVFYHFKSTCNTPTICEVIGYEDTFDDWAVITIRADKEIINIHSDFLLEMKRKGTAFQKNNTIVPSTDNDPNTYVVFDIETTGTNHKKDEIIELSAIKVNSSEITEFSHLISITGVIPVDITSLTGITNEMIYDSPRIDTILPQFLDFIGNCKLIGHNISSFDCYFINDACEKYGYPKLTNEIIDTLSLAKNKLPDLEHYTLLSLCEYYNIDTSNAHRALADCYMCNELYAHLITDNETLDSSNKDDNFIHSSDDVFLQQLIDSLSQICSDKELLPDSLRLLSNSSKNGTSFSICAYEYAFPLGSDKDSCISFLNIKFNSKGSIRLEFREYIFTKIGNPPPYTKSSIREDKQTGNKIIILTFDSKTEELRDYICKIILYRLKYYRTSRPAFGCCNKFMECSDALKCVHDNKLYSTACTYRHRLENGIIFYGKNRNVD